MKNKGFFIGIINILFLSIILSCEKSEDQQDTKEGKGTIWLSGGLYFCAEQIRMDSGDTLIVTDEYKILAFKSGDRVWLKYCETDQNESGCEIGIDCEIIEIKKTD